MKHYLILIPFLLATISYQTTSSFFVSRDILPVNSKLNCTIAQVDDWDTFDIQCWEKYIPNVRLYWVNAPDSDGPNLYKHCYYNEAKNAVNLLIKREMSVEFYWSDLCKDPFKGCRNLVKLNDINTWLDINELFIEKWFAFSWTQFSNMSQDIKLKYIKAEFHAKTINSWLWWKCNVVYNSGALVDSWIASKMTE